MTTAIIHLSDLHYQQGKAEEYGVLLTVLFDDLKKQITQLGDAKIYLAFSGDIVQSGSQPNHYSAFLEELGKKLDELNIPRSHRICVPGNHDVSTDIIKSTLIEHEGVISQRLNEAQFNDYLSNLPSLLFDKFNPYLRFESEFSDIGITKSITGRGHEIDDNIGVYCLNSALCACGGITGADGKKIIDKRRLGIDTRSLYAWLQSTKARWKILVLHHPLDWLTEWAERELRTILRNHFTLCLSGHLHDQSAFHSITDNTQLIECSAPPLFTDKAGDLGYTIIRIDPDSGVTELAYRQWTKHRSFVSGVNFSNTDDGRIVLAKTTSLAVQVTSMQPTDNTFIDSYLTKRLDDSLISFSGQPRVWVEPILSVEAETSKDARTAKHIIPTEIVYLRESIIVKAPPQFGLTCLAHYLIREAWRSPKSSLLIYLDSNSLKPNTASIQAAVNYELMLLRCKHEDIEGVVLDSWTSQEQESVKLLKKVCEYFQELPVIVMHTLDSNEIISKYNQPSIGREFRPLYLWALPRGHIRQVVAEYNETRHIGDEDKVTKRIVADLDALNLHRTALNCLTLLKVSEIDFDESPVNRCEMIKRVLFLLFNADNIPTYKTRPDLKDCEYVLGYFCESMLKDNNYLFTRDNFIRVLQECCKDRFIELEVQVVFDVLHAANIITRRGNFFAFKFTYWINYFAAQRMHHEEAFAQYIFEDMRYAKCPEIIEFYTGTDRRREDALRILTRDIRSVRAKVEEKCGFPEDFDPYRLAQWTSSPEALEKMETEIREGILESNLPAVVKDQYADHCYDRSKPYDQDIKDILNEYSFIYMARAVSAGAKALRNSDYVNPDLKRELLKEILKCWEQTTKVLLVVLPILAEDGHANFDGANFLLHGDFGDSPYKRMISILVQIPNNVVRWSQDDLYSQKMGPLLLDHLNNETNELCKHELALFLIFQRPRGWRVQIEKYIASLGKNSFYLCDVYHILRGQYRYGYASPRSLSDMEDLIKTVAVKHVTGGKIPGAKQFKKVHFNENPVPTREVVNEN